MAIKVSIVIPSRNEEEFILRCLDSIFKSDFHKEQIEIIVCDGKSEDNTAAIVEEFGKNHFNVRLLINEHLSTPFALNLGIINAVGEIVLILGAHAELSINYISECVSVLEKMPDVWCVGGVLNNISSDELTNSVSLAMSSPFGVGNAHFRTGGKSGYVDTVAFGVYRKNIFEQIGYFDEDLIRNQDDELNFRVLKNGGKIWLSTTTSANYFVRSSFTKLFKQYFQYGYWKVFVNKKHKTVTTIRQLIPAFFVSGVYVGLIAIIFFPSRWEYFVLYLMLYGAAASFFALRISKSVNQFFEVLFTFLILHMSYGMGYIEGLVSFILLQKQPSKAKSVLTR